MKILKKIFYAMLFLIMSGCLGIFICAFNPSLTQLLSAALYKEESVSEEEDNENNSLENNKESNDWDSNSSDQEMDMGIISKEPYWEQEEQPSLEKIQIPKNVSGRSGFEVIKGEENEISDTEAVSLKQTLNTGATGEEYEFSADMYPYYAMLDENMQQLYRQIYANAMEIRTSFAPVCQVSIQKLKNVFKAVYNDHPELFWLETGYSCKYKTSGECVEINLKYNQTTKNMEQTKATFDEQAKEIIDAASQLSNDYEKEKYVHDTLVSNVEYVTNAVMNQSAYSALVNGQTVCAGYARAYQYILQQLGIPCYYCTGYAGENHAWNIVKLDDGYYNVDVTWADTDPSTYDYFNKTDADYQTTHIRENLSVYLPACNGEKYRNIEVEAEEDTTEPESEIDALINTNPQEPLIWEAPEVPETEEDEEEEVSVKDTLEAAGISENEFMETIEDYYENCLDYMLQKGTGNIEFSNVVPEELWDSIEKAYNDGSYKAGYVEESLRKLEIENFAIQLQVQKLSGDYYRIYHNIATW